MGAPRRPRAGEDKKTTGWARPFRSRPALLIIVLAFIMSLASCDSSPTSDGPGSSTSPSTEASEVQLAATGPALAAQCRTAARELGFAVPCPTLLPTVDGQVPNCASRCIGTVGELGHQKQTFFLEVADFDGGSDLGPVHHLVIEARPVSIAPALPCPDGVPGTPLPEGVLTLFCPELVGAEASKILEGEGVHANHQLAYFDRGGVRYVVSAHGHTQAAADLVATIIESLSITEG